MNSLNSLRKSIDKTDSQILELLKKRVDLVSKVGEIKKKSNLKIKDLKREKQILEKISKKARDLTLSPVIIKKIWKLLFKQSYISEK